MAKTIATGFISDKVNGIKVNSSKPAHSMNYTKKTSRKIKKIIVHYTGNKQDTAYANANYFSKARATSAHFFVDPSNIYQSVRLKDIAYHAGNWDVNCESIGVEMCTSGSYLASAKTIKNTAYLVANLCKRAGITASMVDKCVLRHYDITKKACPKQFSNGGKNDADWIAFKKQVKNILNPQPTVKTVNYKVKVTASSLNIRKGAGIGYAKLGAVKKNEVYTIVRETKVGNAVWGRLKKGPIVGNSWICLTDYTKKV